MTSWRPPVEGRGSGGMRAVAGARSGPGAADVDGAPAAPGVDRDGVLGTARGLGLGDRVAHLPAVGADVEPGGDALTDADLDGAVGRLQPDLAAADLGDPEVAVGRGAGDRRLGARDVDAAVGAPDPQVAGHGADGRAAVRVLQHGGAVDPADAYGAGAAGDLGGALDPLHDDLAVRRGHLQ